MPPILIASLKWIKFKISALSQNHNEKESALRDNWSNIPHNETELVYIFPSKEL